MCLITNLKKCLVASEDFVCYKKLRKSNKGYITPYQKTDVTLNAVMKTGEPDYVYKDKNFYNKFSIEGGFIHASIERKSDYMELDSDEIIVKCICRKGTEYYIDDNPMTICARELYVTDEIIDCEKLGFDKDNFTKVFAPILDDVKEGEVAVGDYLLSDKTFVHVKDYDGQKTVIGVVGYITNNGEAIVTALNEKKLEWSNQRELVDGLPTVTSHEDAAKDMNGREYTNVVLNSKQFSDKDYPAFAYVKNYVTEGTEKGDWYLSAPGELLESLAKNMLKINISLLMLNDKDIDLINYSWYWASAEGSQSLAWYCYTNYAYVNGSLNKWNTLWVRPAFAINVA